METRLRPRLQGGNGEIGTAVSDEKPGGNGTGFDIAEPPAARTNPVMGAAWRFALRAPSAGAWEVGMGKTLRKENGKGLLRMGKRPGGRAAGLRESVGFCVAPDCLCKEEIQGDMR